MTSLVHIGAGTDLVPDSDHVVRIKRLDVLGHVFNPGSDGFRRAS